MTKVVIDVRVEKKNKGLVSVVIKLRADLAEMDAKFLAYYMDTHKFWMQKDRCKVRTSIIGIRVLLW